MHPIVPFSRRGPISRGVSPCGLLVLGILSLRLITSHASITPNENLTRSTPQSFQAEQLEELETLASDDLAEPSPDPILNQLRRFQPGESCRIRTTWNCFGSVNNAIFPDGPTNANRLDPRIQNWPSQEFNPSQKPLDWRQINASIQPGDVVEFLAQDCWKDQNNGTLRRRLRSIHVQMALENAATMWSANNQANLFDPTTNLPRSSWRWDICSVEDYHAAIMESLKAWHSQGIDRHVLIIVYHRPRELAPSDGLKAAWSQECRRLIAERSGRAFAHNEAGTLPQNGPPSGIRFGVLSTLH